MNSWIEVRDLGKRFQQEWIFKGLTARFEAGTIYAIVGPNGSGKSTLLQVLWGQLPPSRGTLQYQIEGRSVAPADIFEYVSIATPYLDLIEEFTCEEHLRFHFAFRKTEPAISGSDALDWLELRHARHKRIQNFSSGMRQRLRLGLAFLTQAPLLFLDEPATNLDAHALEWYRNRLEEVRKRRLVLIASNNPVEYPAGIEKVEVGNWK